MKDLIILSVIIIALVGALDALAIAAKKYILIGVLNYG